MPSSLVLKVKILLTLLAVSTEASTLQESMSPSPCDLPLFLVSD